MANTCKYCSREIPDFLRFCGKRCMDKWKWANPTLCIGYGMFTRAEIIPEQRQVQPGHNPLGFNRYKHKEQSCSTTEQ